MEPAQTNSFIQWFGNYHLILVHFPIALILAAVISEIFALVTKNPQYEFTTRFLLVVALIFFIPTALSGWAIQEGIDFTPQNSKVFWWHWILALTTGVLTLLTVLANFLSGRGKLYYILFVLMTISLIATAYFGGILAFGDIDWLPPL